MHSYLLIGRPNKVAMLICALRFAYVCVWTKYICGLPFPVHNNTTIIYYNSTVILCLRCYACSDPVRGWFGMQFACLCCSMGLVLPFHTV